MIRFMEVRKIFKKNGLTISKRDGEYRVSYVRPIGTENTAYYTDDLTDALKTGLQMVEPITWGTL